MGIRSLPLYEISPTGGSRLKYSRQSGKLLADGKFSCAGGGLNAGIPMTIRISLNGLKEFNSFINFKSDD